MHTSGLLECRQLNMLGPHTCMPLTIIIFPYVWLQVTRAVDQHAPVAKHTTPFLAHLKHISANIEHARLMVQFLVTGPGEGKKWKHTACEVIARGGLMVYLANTGRQLICTLAHCTSHRDTHIAFS